MSESGADVASAASSSTSSASPALLHMDGVGFAYAGKPSVLDNASAEIGPGLTRITGPSGAGKSTLLRLLCRLEEPRAGRILLQGQDIRELPPPLLRRKLLYVQQTPTLVAGSLRHNLTLPFSFAANRDLTPPDDGRLRELLNEFLLSDLDLDQAAKGLSVGQKQRVCLIRGLLLSPVAMLLDEPTSALDPESASVVVQAACRLPQERGVAVVMVSHGQELDRRECAVLDLRDQKLHAVGQKSGEAA